MRKSRLVGAQDGFYSQEEKKAAQSNRLRRNNIGPGRRY